MRKMTQYKVVWRGLKVFVLKEANGKYFQKVLGAINRMTTGFKDLLKILSVLGRCQIAMNLSDLPFIAQSMRLKDFSIWFISSSFQSPDADSLFVVSVVKFSFSEGPVLTRVPMSTLLKNNYSSCPTISPRTWLITTILTFWTWNLHFDHCVWTLSYKILMITIWNAYLKASSMILTVWQKTTPLVSL